MGIHEELRKRQWTEGVFEYSVHHYKHYNQVRYYLSLFDNLFGLYAPELKSSLSTSTQESLVHCESTHCFFFLSATCTTKATANTSDSCLPARFLQDCREQLECRKLEPL
jgi:hypothetical protein